MFLRVVFGLLIWFLLIRNIQTVNVPNIYEWMEKNAYICETFNPSKSINKPVFLMAKEAKEFTCDEICGNPAQTELACGRILNEQTSENPNCFKIPKICIQKYVREFPSTLEEFVSTTKNIGNNVEFVDEFTESKIQKENFTNFTNSVETKTNIILTTLNSTNLAGKTETISSTTKLSTLFTTTPPSSSTLTLLTTNSSTSLPKTFSIVQSSSSNSTLQSASTATTTSSTPTTATNFSSTSNVSSTLTTVFPTTSTTQQLFKNLKVITSTSPASTSAQVSTTTTTQALPTTSLLSSTLTSPSTTTLSTSTTTTRVFSSTSSIPSTSASITTPLTTFTTQKPLKNAETTTLMINTLPASKSAPVTTGSSSTTTIISTSPTTSLITPISSTTLTLPTTTTTTTTILSTPKTSKISTETTTTNTTTTTTSPIISTISRKSIETTTRLTTFTTQRLSENPKTTVVLSTLSPTTTTSSATTPQPTTPIIFSAAKKINSAISTVPTITPTTTTISLSSLSKPSSTILSQFTTKSLQSSKNELSPTMTSELPITTSSTTFIMQNSTKNNKILPITAVVSSITPQSSTTTIFLNKSSSASTSSIITTILTKLFPTSTLKAIPNNNGSANTQSIMHLFGFTLPTAKNSITQSSDADLIINSTSTLISSTIDSTTTESLTKKQILPGSTLLNTTFATTNPTFSFGISSSTSSSNLLNKQLTPVNRTSEVPISTEFSTKSSTLFISKIPSPFSFEKKNPSSLVNSASTSSTINKISVFKSITANPPSKTTRKSNNVVVTGFSNGRLSMASAVEFQDVSKHLFKQPKIFPDLIRKPFPTTHGFSETEKKFEFELKKVEEVLKRFRISTTSPQTVGHRETRSTAIENKTTTLLAKRILIDDQTIPAIFFTNRLINSPTTTPRFAIVDGEASREHSAFEKLPPSEFNLTTKKSEFSQKFTEKPRKKFFFRNRFSGETVLAPEQHECVDGDPACEFWANNGECAINPRYMLLICRISCKVCQPFN